ncbi:hypothetical protein B0I35DRAFT_434063 [Stachybotrys elegans]|uniref:Uncharacterized protein n=1 Tax=Stachybotrys elegans TaxID=80388 RepID=A0A8K0SNL0_9HYPO|nr:hypothetical protein B0I35DRAFT_434063 [Stachybotrys elegans]
MLDQNSPGAMLLHLVSAALAIPTRNTFHFRLIHTHSSLSNARLTSPPRPCPRASERPRLLEIRPYSRTNQKPLGGYPSR